MFSIIVYDVSIKRVSKVCQFLRQYLNWIQNSVFEGEITESQFFTIKEKLKEIIDKNEDSIIIYLFISEKILKKEHLGIIKVEPSFVI